MARKLHQLALNSVTHFEHSDIWILMPGKAAATASEDNFMTSSREKLNDG
jgi:hypothetical protein